MRAARPNRSNQGEPPMPARSAAILAACLLLASAPASAQEVAADVEEVRQCVERNLPAQSAQQDLVLETADKSGSGQRIEATLYWKKDDAGRSRILMRVESPADLRDSAFLVLERESGDPDMFTYVPELRTVRRITGRTVSGSLFGTDLTYEDLNELQSVSRDAKVERMPDGEVDGRPAYVLSGTPNPGSASSYTKVVTWIDRERCVTRKAEFYDRPDHVAKQLSVPWDEVKPEGERWLPRLVQVKDLDQDSETTLRVEKARYDVDLSEGLFSQGQLARGR
jgi:hypothetical protein